MLLEMLFAAQCQDKDEIGRSHTAGGAVDLKHCVLGLEEISSLGQVVLLHWSKS